MEALTNTLGIGIGKVKLRLVSQEAAIGEVLRGRVELDLDRVVEADRLTVSVLAWQRMVAVDFLNRSPTISTRKLPVVKKQMELAGEAIYRSGSYDFAIEVPAVNWGPKVPLPEGLAEVVGVISAVTSPVRMPLEWFVEARLHRTWKVDLTERLQITVPE